MTKKELAKQIRDTQDVIKLIAPYKDITFYKTLSPLVLEKCCHDERPATKREVQKIKLVINALLEYLKLDFTENEITIKKINEE